MPDLKSLLAPVSCKVATLDLTDTDAAETALAEAFPADGETVRDIEIAARAGLAGGTLCDRENAGVRFSRIAKPDADPGGCSIDAVYMADSPGPIHTHTKGEVCLCFADGGEPAFEGRRETWMVLPPGSRHAPTVTEGKMLIIYWWPDGAVAWK
ncbi:MAG: DUF4863 domain-containing protein [Planctomycetes bacterium]|nr:DUF4863 domain-containing protein [Planctomycetota bacterium]